jgi:hypothetical protein
MVTIKDSEAVNGFLNTPFFSRVISSSGYKSVGIRIVGRDKVVNELTSSYVNKKLSIKDGIRNPDFIVTVDHKFLKSLDKKKLGWIRENPVKAYFRYHDKVDVPFMVKLKIMSMLKDEA